MHVTIAVERHLIVGAVGHVMADDETQFDKEADRVVERGTANTKIALAKHLVEFLQGEVAGHAENGLKYRVALGGLAMIVHLKIIVQYVPCSRLDVIHRQAIIVILYHKVTLFYL